MTDKIIWEARPRIKETRGTLNQLRTQGFLPAVVYGGADKPQNLNLIYKDIIKFFEKSDDIYNSIIDLKLESSSEKVIIKAIQRHPAKGSLVHIDLQRVIASKPVKKVVPFVFEGARNSPGVKMGAKITYLIKSSEVKSMPEKLPKVIKIDVSKMASDTSFRLSDLSLPEGVEFTALSHDNKNYDQSVVSLGKVQTK